jgi:hypothetical protein
MIYKILLSLILTTQTFAVNIDQLVRADSFQSHRLPMISYISNSTIAHNNSGDYTFTFLSVINEELRACIWFSPKDSSLGRIIHVAELGNTLSDPSINEVGEVSFLEYNEAKVRSLYKYNSNIDELSSISIDSNRFMSARDAKINNFGDIIFRATDISGHKEIVLLKNGTFHSLITSYKSPYSYIFSAKFLGNDSVALKVRLGQRGEVSESRPDQLLKVSLTGDKLILAEDKDSLSSSSITQFNNSISTQSKHRNVAFVGKDENSKRSLYRIYNGVLSKVISEGELNIKTLEYFSPSINSHGNIAFRGIDSTNKRNIFLFNGNKVVSLVKSGSLIDSDVTTARIHAKNGPDFGGGLNLNDSNEVIFQAKIYTKEIERPLGTAVLRASF